MPSRRGGMASAWGSRQRIRQWSVRDGRVGGVWWGRLAENGRTPGMASVVFGRGAQRVF